MNHFGIDDDLYEECDFVRQSRGMASQLKSNEVRVGQVNATDG